MLKVEKDVQNLKNSCLHIAPEIQGALMVVFVTSRIPHLKLAVSCVLYISLGLEDERGEKIRLGLANWNKVT